ncbi:MAG: hypothetical protein RIQ53_2751 [Pseudomonadota bacterium]|jgi:DNA-binding transcriptional MerR regulator
MEKTLPPIPAKRYFTIGEVSELCQVKPYVLRYWEQEFSQLRPMKRRGNRRYYQHHEVLLVRRIRELLYDQGFTISGARNQLGDAGIAPSASDAGVAAAERALLGGGWAQGGPGREDASPVSDARSAGVVPASRPSVRSADETDAAVGGHSPAVGSGSGDLGVMAATHEAGHLLQQAPAWPPSAVPEGLFLPDGHVDRVLLLRELISIREMLADF